MSVTNAGLKQSERIAMVNLRKWRFGWPLAGLFLLTAGGCHNIVDNVPGPAKETFPPVPQVAVGNPPGLPVNPAPPNLINDLVSNYKTVARPDAFALHPDEVEYDTKARNEKVFATGQYWQPLFIPKPEVVIVDTVEPQPFRRLAGVLIGDSVMAIIDMGDNMPMQVIRPGMQIPNSPWKVISIDEDKAVLRRSGNKRPKEIVVRLQGPISSGPVTTPANPSPGGNPNQNPNRAPRRGGVGGGGGGGRGGIGGVG